MNSLHKNHLISVAVLFLSFIAVYGIVQWQFGVFTQPYFWDELGVYSRASVHLYKNGLSLLPSAIPDELSRGHPLFCPFYFALAFKLFGCTPLIAHLAAAFLNMLGFYCCYRILAKFVPNWHAVFGTIAIFVQVLFLSQSVLVLPEMPLMVATLAAVMFYLYGQPWAVTISLLLALQIKESALVLPLAFIIADTLAQGKLKGKSLLLYLIIPLFSFVLFICIQYLHDIWKEHWVE